jgi:hypothetical protein
MVEQSLDKRSVVSSSLTGSMRFMRYLLLSSNGQDTVLSTRKWVYFLRKGFANDSPQEYY